MALFKFLWLRRMIRKHTSPIPFKLASSWRDRLSVTYAFLAWTALGYIGLIYMKGGKQKHNFLTEDELRLSPAQRFAIKSEMSQAKILRLYKSGTAQVDFNLEDYVKPEEEKDELPWNTQQTEQLKE